MEGLIETEQLCVKKVIADHVLIVGKLEIILNGCNSLLHNHTVDPAGGELSDGRIFSDKR